MINKIIFVGMLLLLAAACWYYVDQFKREQATDTESQITKAADSAVYHRMQKIAYKDSADFHEKLQKKYEADFDSIISKVGSNSPIVRLAREVNRATIKDSIDRQLVRDSLRRLTDRAQISQTASGESANASPSPKRRL